MRSKGISTHRVLNRDGVAFETTAIDEVWGIGSGIGAKLNSGGIASVADLLKADVHALRRQFSTELDDIAAPGQQFMHSRSFGRPVHTIEDMIEAVSAHATRVAKKARYDESIAGAVRVFAHTSPHRTQDRQSARA